MQKAETLELKPITLLLIGHGKMGGALFARWAAARPAGIKHLVAIDPAAAIPSSADMRFFPSLDKLPEAFKPDVIVIAVKPQQMDNVLPEYAARFGAKALYLSIAAGKSLAYFEKKLGTDTAVVRAMPNTPALIGESMTALTANKNISVMQKETAASLMNVAGKTVWVEESVMDAVTAISGSGPAYVFLFMEALHNAAIKSGLSDEVATALVRQTVKGSALLAEENDFAALRKNVTSPGGTTEAAIKILQAGGFEKLIGDAVAAAVKRAKEL
jgi:pyrroline-5-carboxylate reductase